MGWAGLPSSSTCPQCRALSGRSVGERQEAGSACTVVAGSNPVVPTLRSRRSRGRFRGDLKRPLDHFRGPAGGPVHLAGVKHTLTQSRWAMRCVDVRTFRPPRTDARTAASIQRPCRQRPVLVTMFRVPTNDGCRGVPAWWQDSTVEGCGRPRWRSAVVTTVWGQTACDQRSRFTRLRHPVQPGLSLTVLSRRLRTGRRHRDRPRTRHRGRRSGGLPARARGPVRRRHPHPDAGRAPR